MSNTAQAGTTPMMVKDFLSANAVVSSLGVTNKKEMLAYLAERAGELLKKNGHDILDILWARERLGTTGVGSGIAIPHGRMAGLDHVTGFFARLTQPVDFEAVDNKPVDLVFILLSPEGAGADHLRALATVSRLLRDAKLCEALRSAKDEAALYRLLVDAPISQAA